MIINSSAQNKEDMPCSVFFLSKSLSGFVILVYSLLLRQRDILISPLEYLNLLIRAGYLYSINISILAGQPQRGCDLSQTKTFEPIIHQMVLQSGYP